MKTLRSISRFTTLAFCAAVVATQAQAAPLSGGTLARASSSSQGGRPVCVIVVLVPGKEGQRPRRREIVVPAD
jgi:hypothetical protein